MGSETQPLSDQAVEALKTGNLLVAIKLIRTERGVDLKEAKDIAEAYLRANPASGEPQGGQAPPVGVDLSTGSLPPLSDDAMSALRGGNMIEAIKLIRAGSGLGLKEAKDVAEGYVRMYPELADVYARRGPPIGIILVIVIAVIAIALMGWLAP